jgi:arylsulfatase A-like enzyme
MRPDFVRPDTTPTLASLAQSGVTFKNHHPVYLTTTEVNGTALATGVYPGQNGIIGNEEFRSEIEPQEIIQTESLDAVRKGDLLTTNHYLAVPTVSELLHHAGLSTVIAGAKPVALLHDRLPRTNLSAGVTLFAGRTLPEEFQRELANLLGPFPDTSLSSTNRDRWTTDALIGPLWDRVMPAFSVLWLSEPDRSQHNTGPGSAASLAAIRHSDQMLGRMLAALDRKGLRHSTDVIVLSDHAFSTIDKAVDIAAVLSRNGFRAFREVPPAGLRTGDVLIVPDGGSALLYVAGHGPARVENVVHLLQAQPFAGVLFTRQSIPGTFSLAEARMDSPSAPDIILSLRWSSGTNASGVPGLLLSDDGQRGPGDGMHGSLSPYDLHNFCVAAGPDFKSGVVDYLPTGNIDIAPTILTIFGIEPQHKLSGRVLREAFASEGPISATYESRKIEASFNGKNFVWRQYLNYSLVNGVTYFDEGNGEQLPQKGLAAFQSGLPHGENSFEPHAVIR